MQPTFRSSSVEKQVGHWKLSSGLLNETNRASGLHDSTWHSLAEIVAGRGLSGGLLVRIAYYVGRAVSWGNHLR